MLTYCGTIVNIFSEFGSRPLRFAMKTDDNKLMDVIYHGNDYSEFNNVDREIRYNIRVIVTGNRTPILSENPSNPSANTYFRASTITLDTQNTDHDSDSSSSTSSSFTSGDEYVPDSEGEEVHSRRTQLRVTGELTVTKDNIIFHDNTFPIVGMRTMPGRIRINTDLGKFYFDDMGYGVVSVTVPKTSYEPEFKRGYNILTRVSFSTLLEVIY